MFRRIAAILAVLSMMLLVAAPAMAQSLSQETPIAWNDADFQGTEEECADVVLDPGEVYWHFIHTMTSSTDLPSSLTVTFSDGSTQTVNGYVNGNSIVMYDVYTTGELDLVSAVDTIGTDANPIGLLNLSNICSGGPPPVIPEAPASVLLVVTAALAAAGFVVWQMRRSTGSALA